MHLSMLSDCYLSDAMNDFAEAAETEATACRNGLLRGLAMMGIAGVLLGLTLFSSGFHAAEADTSRCGRRDPFAAEKVQAAVWWEANDTLSHSTHAAIRHSAMARQTGTSVSMVALRQRFRSACR